MPSLNILVVDDNEMIRSSLCAILQQHDFEVTCAGDVPEALRLILLHNMTYF